MFTAEQNEKFRSLVMRYQSHLNEMIEVAKKATDAILTDMELHDKLNVEVNALRVKADAAARAAIDYRNSVLNGTEE